MSRTAFFVVLPLVAATHVLFSLLVDDLFEVNDFVVDWWMVVVGTMFDFFRVVVQIDVVAAVAVVGLADAVVDMVLFFVAGVVIPVVSAAVSHPYVVFA